MKEQSRPGVGAPEREAETTWTGVQIIPQQDDYSTCLWDFATIFMQEVSYYAMLH